VNIIFFELTRVLLSESGLRPAQLDLWSLCTVSFTCTAFNSVL